jgi:hypothetical protein
VFFFRLCAWSSGCTQLREDN